MSKDDVSLDDELLLVTEKKSSNKVQKKARQDKSPKRDDEEGELSGSSGEDSDHKGGKRKPKTDSKKPLKKRKTDSSDEESSGDEPYDDGWDDELMGDQADRDKLEAMPMIEREAILAERYNKRKEMREAWAVKRRLKEEQRSRRDKERKEGHNKKDVKDSRDKRDSRSERDRSERDRSERDRSERDRSERDRSERDRAERDRSERDRGARKPDNSKGKALSELKKKRAKAGYKKSDSDEDFEDGEVEETKGEEEDDDDYAPKKSDKSSDHDIGKTSKAANVVIHNYDDEDRITFSEVEQLRLGRETLEKWVDKPFFSKLVPGFFVRIGIGMDPSSRMNVYRLAQIESVENKSSYLMSGKQTTKWLKLLIADKAKDFKMETISNRPFTESEYSHWKMRMETSRCEMPRSSDVPKKLETLAAAKDYRYTSSDIEAMLQEKKDAGSLPVKVAAEKAKLVILRDTATDPEEKANYEQKIAQLDEMTKERREKKRPSTGVSNINQRNKNYNFVTTLESKGEEASGNDLDPFSRRRTLPRITYASKHKDDEEKLPGPEPSDVIPPTTIIPANGILFNNNTPLKTSAGVTAPTSEHDSIDIDIPLASSSTTTSRPFLSSAPTPTTPPFVQPEKKTKSLSLNDYMKRRQAMES